MVVAPSTPSHATTSESSGDPEFAAVDLGSNSFHMAIARSVGREMRQVDKIKESVQLARGLGADQRLSDEAQARALECLARFGERLSDLPPDRVRAVGTNTLRKARNARDFLRRAADTLGHPIEIISGREEARLVYLGVVQTFGYDTVRRLVVDIGGGSTECIIGEGTDTLARDSLYMGCVSFSLAHFPDGRIDAARMRRAVTAAQVELEPIQRAYVARGWREAVGSSGTIAAIAEIVRRNGWGAPDITLAGLRRLEAVMIEQGAIDRLAIDGLKGKRATVLPGGLAILRALFEGLGIESMAPSSGALRDGVIYDLVGRAQHEDVRDRTIQRFVEDYHVDVEQAMRVQTTVLEAYEQVASAWELDDPVLEQALRWASWLHEIGLELSYRGYHRHGAYLTANSDMPGFSTDDQVLLSTLIHHHRRKLMLSEEPTRGLSQRQVLRLVVLFRLATDLNRSRGGIPVPPFTLTAEDTRLHLRFPDGWLAEHPLTAADLEAEAGYLERVDIAFRFE
jgi:exopolyphosphatase/guanosine-5'-triphosphate,3'-diphosphate pyrophosphatase